MSKKDHGILVHNILTVPTVYKSFAWQNPVWGCLEKDVILQVRFWFQRQSIVRFCQTKIPMYEAMHEMHSQAQVGLWFLSSGRPNFSAASQAMQCQVYKLFRLQYCYSAWKLALTTYTQYKTFLLKPKSVVSTVSRWEVICSYLSRKKERNSLHPVYNLKVRRRVFFQFFARILRAWNTIIVKCIQQSHKSCSSG